MGVRELGSVAGYRVQLLDAGGLALDGGAMYGNVPRVLWERHHTPDARHRIRLATWCLLLSGHGRRVLIESGCGHLWSEKEAKIFATSLAPEPPVFAALAEAGVAPGEVTDVVLTHLHFDHAGGIARRGPQGEPVPSFPQAVHHVQKRNLAQARNPNLREQASYLERHIARLDEVELRELDGPCDVLPGLSADLSDGHTEGLQTLLLGEGREALFVPADLCPLATHVAIPWCMGYDLSPRTIMAEKESQLGRALDAGYRIVLEHDALHPLVRIREDERGRWSAAPIPAEASD